MINVNVINLDDVNRVIMKNWYLVGRDKKRNMMMLMILSFRPGSQQILSKTGASS